MSNVSCGEYYLLQYSYYHNDEITYGDTAFKIDVAPEYILEKIKWYYENYKQYDIRIELLKVNAVRIPLEIKPVDIRINLDL
ncbi:MAG: hypothetical protein WC503_06120 [Candidatus Shapirobacteria bacterium]